MAQIAAFASSPDGRLYGAVCERYSVDPAAGLTDDPIEAANIRVALAVATASRASEPETSDPEPTGFLTAEAHLG